MDPIFDRLGNLIRSMFQEGSSESRSHDPDIQDAWDELDDYLKSDPPKGRKSARPRPVHLPPRELEQDYLLLEVPFGAPFSEVKRGYKKMIARYHPDKHAEDSSSFDKATELSQKINAAFRRIERYEEGRK